MSAKAVLDTHTNLPDFQIGDLIVGRQYGHPKWRAALIVKIDYESGDIWLKWSDRTAKQCIPGYRQAAWFEACHIKHYPKN